MICVQDSGYISFLGAFFDAKEVNAMSNAKKVSFRPMNDGDDLVYMLKWLTDDRVLEFTMAGTASLLQRRFVRNIRKKRMISTG